MSKESREKLLKEMKMLSGDDIMVKRFRNKAKWEIEKEEELEESLEKGIEKGYAYGLEEGIMQGKEEIAKALLNKNINVNTIIECTGLTLEEIKKLNND